MYTRSFTSHAASVALVFASLAACSDPALAPSERLTSTQQSAALAAPGTITAIDLGLLPGDNYVSHANALNKKREVVGRSWHIAAPGVELGRAFFWEPDGPSATTGQITALVMPFGMPESSDAIDINDKGIAVGWSQTPFVAKVAVLWKDGLGSPLPDVDGNPAVGAGAVAINNRGDAVLQSGTHVLLWTPDFEGARTGSSALLGSFNAHAINDRREVVGSSIGLGVALVWRPDAPGATTGTLSDLGSFGGSENVATDVNNQGEITGYSTTSLGTMHAFVWRPDAPHATSGTMLDLNPTLGASTALASAINDKGEVTGRGSFPPYSGPQAWVLRPEPKPNSSAVTILGSTVPDVPLARLGPDINDRGDVAYGLNARATLWRH